MLRDVHDSTKLYFYYLGVVNGNDGQSVPKKFRAVRGRKVLLWFQPLRASSPSLRSLLYMLAEKGLRLKVRQSVSAQVFFFKCIEQKANMGTLLLLEETEKFTDASEDDLPTLGQLNSPGHSYTQGP